MSDKRLQEQNEEQRKKIQGLQIALMNADAIAETLVHHGKMFDELKEMLSKLGGRLANLESEVGHQKNLIVKSLQQKYGTGPTS